jgi:hypothetical protein
MIKPQHYERQTRMVTPMAAGCGSLPRFRTGDLEQRALSLNGRSVVFDPVEDDRW